MHKWTRIYRILCIIPVLLSAATFAVFSQTFRLDIDNEPLNKVLNELGLEISYDDRALSAYSVSAAMSFENQEKALSWLLESKPFRIEKIGTVYVIVPFDNQPQAESNSAFHPTGSDRLIYRGTVVSQVTGEPLEFATVSLLGNNNQLFTTGITAENGQFAIQSTRIPVKVKISYLGHETLLRDVHNLNAELGIFPLNEEIIALSETVVTPDFNPQGINRSIYTVDPDLRHGADNALELLNKIPGASFDPSTRVVRLNHQTNILLLVDGIQQSYSYLNHLSPGRIQAVEVVYALSGRFVSDDYAGIIHFMLKKDYTGYDFHIRNAISVNLSKTAGGNRLSEHTPSAGFIYTTRKLNFFGMYEQHRENRTLHASKSLTYIGSELVSMPGARPNDRYKNKNYSVTGGLNYHFNPFQLIGIQTDYTSANTYTFQEYTMRRTDLSNDQNRILTNETENRINAYHFTGSIFYQGQISNRLHLYSDFSCNYYYNDMANEYRQDEPPNYRYFDRWDEYKNQTVLNVEANYKLSGAMTIEAGYSNIGRQYASESSQGRGFLDYGEHRNKVFIYQTWYLSDNTGLKSGLALEYIKQRNRENESNYYRVLPFLLFSYNISRTTTMAAGYATNQFYPSLNQLSPISITIDTFLNQIGNPVLKSAVRHQTFLELSLWNKLKIRPQINYISDGFSEVYERKEFKLYRTFDNMNFREYSLHFSFEQMLGKHFRLKNSANFYHDEALYSGIRSSVNGWTFHSEADYYHARSSFGLQLGFYRDMRKNILWQGYQMSDRDYWCISARKELWNNRIAVMLSYIPPIALGVRYDRLKEMDTSLYKEKTAMNLESCNQMLLLTISVRFDRGSRKPTESRTEKRSYEREKGVTN